MKTLSTIATRISVFALAISAVVLAEELPPRSPVSAQQVRQAVVDELRLRGFQDVQVPHIEDIDLPVAVPVRGLPSLHVSSLCWDENAGHVRFRLQCREAGACLPFLVYVRTPSRIPIASCRIEAAPHAAQERSPTAVRAGDRATAVLLAAGLRMTTRVSCLDRGAKGDIIRVRGPEGRIFRARVSGPALVEAQLP